MMASMSLLCIGRQTLARASSSLLKNQHLNSRSANLRLSLSAPYALNSKRCMTSSELKVSQDRLWKDIHYTCQWGTGQSYGS